MLNDDMVAAGLAYTGLVSSAARLVMNIDSSNPTKNLPAAKKRKTCILEPGVDQGGGDCSSAGASLQAQSFLAIPKILMDATIGGAAGDGHENSTSRSNRYLFKVSVPEPESIPLAHIIGMSFKLTEISDRGAVDATYPAGFLQINESNVPATRGGSCAEDVLRVEAVVPVTLLVHTAYLPG